MMRSVRRHRNLMYAGVVFATLITSTAGATVGFPKPARYVVAPETGCRSALAYVHGTTGAQRKRIPIPATPGLSATALSKRTVRLDWSLRKSPSTCRTEALLLSIGHYPRTGADQWMPMTVLIETRGALSGSRPIPWALSAPPDVALASALMRKGARSRTVAVLIRH
jgi:hypothetical protein